MMSLAKRTLWLCLLSFSAFLPVWPGHSAEQTNAIKTLEQLQQRLTEHISQPRFAAAMWGVKVLSLDSGKVLFEHNAKKLFSPASNSKLYTVALALDRLGPDYRIKTSLYSAAKPNESGTLTN